jgi:hypothetical protein
MDASDIFHFPRTREAQSCFEQLRTGAAHAIVLYGPRRSGKTRFLLRDMAPLAEAAGWRAIYASFWPAPDDPAAAIVHEIERRAGVRTRRAALDLFRQAEISASVRTSGPAVLEAAVKKPAQPRAARPRLLDALLDEMCAGRRRVLLLLDEFQELGVSKAHAHFIAALRTSLDKRSGQVCAIFTGSSDPGLRAMFADQRAPLFNFGDRIALEPLGRAFVAHQRAALAKRGVQVAEAKLERALVALNRRPVEFSAFRNKLLRQDSADPDRALAETRAEMAEHYGFPHIWDALGALPRATFRVLAEAKASPFETDGLEAIARLAGLPAVSAQTVQGAMRTLERRGLVRQYVSRGPYAPLDDAFVDWALARPAAEFRAPAAKGATRRD